MERTFHRGAVVSVRPQGELETRRFRRFQWDYLLDKRNTLTGEQLAAVAKPSRQRRKGPIVRFGRTK